MERSIVARDHVVDHMKTYNLRPFCIDINTDLYMLVKGAAAKYKAYLEKNRKKKDSCHWKRKSEVHFNK